MLWFWWLLVVAGLVFWIWQFVRMLNDRKLKKETKLILVVLFLVASLLTALVYWIYKTL